MLLQLISYLIMAVEIIKPQAGPQEQFLASPADIVIYGGAAGGGKTFGLLMEPLRHIHDPKFTCIGFRRNGTQIEMMGGLWDTSNDLYLTDTVNARAIAHKHKYIFPSGAALQFKHLEHEINRKDHQGGQYVLELWDELTHFTEKQFWYLVSRNRPPKGCYIKPYIRATTNPTHRDDEIGGWVRELIDWWIDKDGFPIPERSGVLRYFTREDDQVIWVDKDWRCPTTGLPPKSFTFIPAKLTDNQILMKQDPTYQATLNSLSRVDRMRLLYGNWDVSEKGGMFEREWFTIKDTAPPGMRLVRYWDRAATEPTPKRPDPDWTAGVLCGMHKGDLYILDMVHFQGSPAKNERNIKNTAISDGKKVVIGLEKEPGSAGSDVIHHYMTKVLKGFTVHPDPPTGDKIDRAKPWCSLAEFGHVYLVRGHWNEPFIKEAINFPNGKKDQIDSVSGAYKELTKVFNYQNIKGAI